MFTPKQVPHPFRRNMTARASALPLPLNKAERFLRMSTDEKNMATEAPTLMFAGNGRMMKPEPNGQTLTRVAALLAAGETVSMQWEPGDATRYDVLLVPLWSKTVDARAIGFANSSTQSIVVINTQQWDCLRGAVIERGGWYGALIDSGMYRSHGHWTVMLFEWLFESYLWPRIDAVRGVVR